MFELHLQKREAVRLMHPERLHGIQHHTVLIGAARPGAAIQIKSGAAAHQHLALPDR